jgi:hypothetical protein
MTFNIGDMVSGKHDTDIGGVVVAVNGSRALVCDNSFAAIMIEHFGATLEYVKDQFDCRWIIFDELELDDDDDE